MDNVLRKYGKMIHMKNKYLLVSLIAIAIVLLSFVFLFKKNGSSMVGDCSKYSNKDGYTGCMSIEKGGKKKCKFKVDNKINQETQQMEFAYSCLEK